MARINPLQLLAILTLLAAAGAGMAYLNVLPDLSQQLPIWCGLIAAAIALTPGIAPRIRSLMAWLDALDGRARARAAMVIALLAGGLLLGFDLALGKPLRLLWHDEFQFHLQSQMVARFKLWMPAHPLVSFFDTFYVLIEPKYAAQSFPGAAMVFAPTVWLNLPTWVMPLVVTSAACGLLWWILGKLVNNTGATLAIIVLLCAPGFQRVSTMYLAQVPLLLLGLLAIVGLIRWTESKRIGWAVLIGASLGWAAITRPLDAVYYGTVVGIGLLLAFRNTPRKSLGIACASIVGCALPFLALQAVFNIGVTGSITKTPFAFYNERDQPALAYGSAGDFEKRPVSDVPQKQRFYDEFTLSFLKAQNDPAMTPRAFWQYRVGTMRAMMASTELLWFVAAVGALGLVTRLRWLVFAVLPLYVFSYHFYPIFLFHYLACALPGLAILYALAPGAIAGAFPRLADAIRGVVLMMTVGMSVGACVDREIHEDARTMTPVQAMHEAIARQVKAPAIVLFTVPQTLHAMEDEPVYNDDVAWPDDAAIIRAHDRGSRNPELFRYYARVSPQRVVWRFDRTTGRLTRLGVVSELETPPQ